MMAGDRVLFRVGVQTPCPPLNPHMLVIIYLLLIITGINLSPVKPYMYIKETLYTMYTRCSQFHVSPSRGDVV